ncbi:MAG: hypothetical protein SFY80_07340 [Verrucomicrobiota bacterium]|nr:hypothetical protein [Verrucomicrobiota bacterium]
MCSLLNGVAAAFTASATNIANRINGDHALEAESAMLATSGLSICFAG